MVVIVGGKFGDEGEDVGNGRFGRCPVVGEGG